MQAPGENLLMKMWETLAERGIGGLLRPWQMRREGKASIELRKQELLQLAQAEADAAAIRSGQRRLGLGGEIIPVAAPTEAAELKSLALEGPREPQRLLLRAVTESTLADATRREVNVAKAILFAEQDIEDSSRASPSDKAPPSGPPDPDWLYRWRDAASEVSAEELQNLWGRVLAGEVKAPGSFSLRTLDFLRNISRPEAEAIELLSHYSLGEFIFRGDEELLNGQGMNMGFLLALQDLGVISGVGGIGLNVTLSSLRPDVFERAFMVGNRVLVIKHADVVKELEFPAYVVSRLGREVFKLGVQKPSEPYLQAIGAAAAGQGFEVNIASGFALPDGRIQYFDPERVQPTPPAA